MCIKDLVAHKFKFLVEFLIVLHIVGKYQNLAAHILFSSFGTIDVFEFCGDISARIFVVLYKKGNR